MSGLRILMYSNDSLGLGHTSRALAIAKTLSKAMEDCSILVLTDLSTIGKFRLPERVDYVHLPNLGPKDNARPSLSGLNLEYANTLKIRRKIAQSAIKTFMPGIVMLDDSLLSIPHEMQKIVSCIADELPRARVFWCLSDTLGDSEYVRRHWAEAGILRVLDRFADEILVFGSPRIFDLEREYQLPKSIAQKLFYTGYLKRPVQPPRRVREEMARMDRSLPMVMLTPSGGAEDLVRFDAYLRFLEAYPNRARLRSFIVVGPAIKTHEKRALVMRARKLPNVVVQRFSKHMLSYIRYADLVIGNGAYDVMCEVLAHRRSAIIVPNAKVYPDRHSRAQIFRSRGFVTVMQPGECHTQNFSTIIPDFLFGGPRLKSTNYDDIPMTGFTKILERVQSVAGWYQPMQAAAAAS